MESALIKDDMIDHYLKIIRGDIKYSICIEEGIAPLTTLELFDIDGVKIVEYDTKLFKLLFQSFDAFFVCKFEIALGCGEYDLLCLDDELFIQF